MERRSTSNYTVNPLTDTICSSSYCMSVAAFDPLLSLRLSHHTMVHRYSSVSQPFCRRMPPLTFLDITMGPFHVLDMDITHEFLNNDSIEVKRLPTC